MVASATSIAMLAVSVLAALVTCGATLHGSQLPSLVRSEKLGVSTFSLPLDAIVMRALVRCTGSWLLVTNASRRDHRLARLCKPPQLHQDQRLQQEHRSWWCSGVLLRLGGRNHLLYLVGSHRSSGPLQDPHRAALGQVHSESGCWRALQHQPASRRCNGTHPLPDHQV